MMMRKGLGFMSSQVCVLSLLVSMEDRFNSECCIALHCSVVVVVFFFAIWELVSHVVGVAEAS